MNATHSKGRRILIVLAVLLAASAAAAWVVPRLLARRQLVDALGIPIRAQASRVSVDKQVIEMADSYDLYARLEGGKAAFDALDQALALDHNADTSLGATLKHWPLGKSDSHFWNLPTAACDTCGFARRHRKAIFVRLDGDYVYVYVNAF